MAAPPITERHKPHFHRRAPIVESVRCATTANVTLASGFENGDVIDGVTLATGDRFLAKDQSTGSQNGIYTVNASGAPTRAYDLSADDPNFGFLVYVREGTTNGGKIFRSTNTSEPTIGSTVLSFAEVGTGAIPAGTYELAKGGGQSVIAPHGSMGSAETFEPDDGNVHTGTLDANLTASLGTPTGSGAAEIEVEITADGSWSWSWPDVDVWLTSDGLPPDPPADGETAILVFRSLDGGTTWLGIPLGGSGGSVTAEDVAALGVVGPLLIADSATVPITFDDILQGDEEPSLLYADI